MANHSPKYQMKKSHTILLLGLLLAILSGSRILWMESFRDHKQELIKNGQFDLRNWNAEDGSILLLDGEWEFYPSQWLIDGSRQQLLGDNAPRHIQVPGGWNEALHADKPSLYGYGSYRLRLYVDPAKNLNYSIRVPSVRTASELYVNGRLLTKSGQVATTKDEYISKDLPYSTTFTADENGVIELVIQAANYVDSRSGGIVRSIKFGSEEAIAKEMKASVSMQFLAAIIFIMHAVYALILYLLGNKEKKLLYFSLLALCVTITSVFSTDEKLFHQLFYIGINWDFRLTNIAFVIAAYALLQCTNHRELPYWRRMYPVYKVMNLGTAGITLFLDPSQVIMLFPVYYLLVGIAAVITLITIFKKVKCLKSNLLLLFSFLALMNHSLWSLILLDSGLSLVYYPFDMIIAMGCLASEWFKGYFIMHANTKELAATLQRMNDHKDQFLANTSHEFKNPLHSMLNMSQSVLKREQHLLQERSIKELETVLSVGRRLTLILNDLIDVMSLQEGNPRLQERAIFIQPIMTGVMDMLQFNAGVKSVQIANQISEDFPPVIADENRVIQIVFNLLHNAVKYTNDGVISIQAFAKDGRAYIVITDTGIGMDEDMLKRLFRPYEQASASETMIEGGFGLGLSISKQLVELHGGALDVSSALGEGSTFTFSLKLADLKAEEENDVSNSFKPYTLQSMAIQEIASSVDLDKVGIPQAAKQPTLLEMDRDRPHLLIVDDDPVNLQVLESILPPDEYEVTMVTSGKEVLAVLDTKEWDLVISDIMMPQMSGYELTRMIRERFTLTELPVLLLTARSQPKDIQSGFIAGANDYVTKPVEAVEIKSRIEALTTIKQSVREQLRLEAAWLQAQIQPHFIFNALNAVIALSDINLDKMRNLLDEFSNFLRNKFKFQDMGRLVPIEEELSLMRSYLYIEKVRFEERLQVIWEIDGCEEIKVPFLTIQPLVENAITHGVMKRIRGGKIFIRISVYETHAEITVEDDGVGMDEVKLQRILERKADSRSGVGLINTDQRLKRHFGTGLHIKSTLGIGTKVTFHVHNRLNSGD
ncbi:hybrid sensor histidine kinase/response regulator [Paenibacillus sp. IHBB 10380]|uniref:hybrid sensor histidine kinase/response regulator n=1 Tax=Paenibacillus sp. IHBB 10380 TaxID=1566358 RepID=UPI0005CFC2C1|nr:ATP-binding protein [Paenibacillus sp. IHBB 10380]AJS59769.1 histidine kinase [Paenibacillus sp. IHBB 10380]